MGNYVDKSKTLKYKTTKRLEFIKITKDIEDFVNESGVDNGTVTIQTQ